MVNRARTNLNRVRSAKVELAKTPADVVAAQTQAQAEPSEEHQRAFTWLVENATESSEVLEVLGEELAQRLGLSVVLVAQKAVEALPLCRFAHASGDLSTETPTSEESASQSSSQCRGQDFVGDELEDWAHTTSDEECSDDFSFSKLHSKKSGKDWADMMSEEEDANDPNSMATLWNLWAFTDQVGEPEKCAGVPVLAQLPSAHTSMGRRAGQRRRRRRRGERV